MEERRDLLRAGLGLGTSLIAALICLLAGQGQSGLLLWALVCGAMVWGALGLTLWLALMSRHGWGGSLGRWIASFLDNDPGPLP